jgi:hypothetical protein
MVNEKIVNRQFAGDPESGQHAESFPAAKKCGFSSTPSVG